MKKKKCALCRKRRLLTYSQALKDYICGNCWNEKIMKGWEGICPVCESKTFFDIGTERECLECGYTHSMLTGFEFVSLGRRDSE